MTRSDIPAQVLDEPAGQRPPGANTNTQPNENGLIYGVWITVLIITTLAVAMRIYSKRFLAAKRTLFVEDYLIIIAWMTNLAQCIMMVPMANAGMGKTMWDITVADFRRASNLVEIWSIIYNITAILVKTAILLQIIRLFVPSRQLNIPLFIACWSLMIIIFLFYTIMAVMIIVIYTRGLATWSPHDEQQSPKTGVVRFVVNGQSSIITAIFNACSDLAILILPLPSIYHLHVDTKRKVAIAGLFATGFLACAVSIVRAAVSGVLEKTTDASWTMAKEGAFALSELAIAIVAFCLPATPPVIFAMRERVSRVFGGREKEAAEGTSRAARISDGGDSEEGKCSSSTMTKTNGSCCSSETRDYLLKSTKESFRSLSSCNESDVEHGVVHESYR